MHNILQDITHEESGPVVFHSDRQIHSDTPTKYNQVSWGTLQVRMALTSICNMFTVFNYIHTYMGQFLQGGKNGRLMSFFF